jgi:amidophosphoribosyltransferase
MPGQQLRKKSVKQKLNALDLEFRGKNVLLVDDSIVRGTTCEQIIEMAREAGAKNVYFASAAPAVRYPNVYGIDMPAKEEFIAHDRSTDDIAKAIGADWLVYQDIEDLVDACLEGATTDAKSFDCSVFNGEYVTQDINDEYFRRLYELRNDANKTLQAVESEAIDLHNPKEA